MYLEEISQSFRFADEDDHPWNPSPMESFLRKIGNKFIRCKGTLNFPLPLGGLAKWGAYNFPQILKGVGKRG